MVVYAKMEFHPEGKGIMFLQHSITDMEAKAHGLPKTPPELHGIVRAEMDRGYVWLEPIDDNSCWMHSISRADPKMKLIPDWFLNWAFKRAAKIMMKKFNKKETYLTGPLAKRMDEKRGFYDELRARLKALGM